MTSELVGGGCAGGGVGEGGGGSSSRITPPSPGTPKKGGKMMAVRVQMLDDSVTMFQVQAKAVGRVLFDQVCKQLNLLEADYFGLEYQEPGGTRYWLDLEKPVCRQVGLTLPESLLRFCVKFYTPDPAQLEEEFTRYLFCLQVKRDLAQGLILCNDNTAALMASYIVQAECGDYVVEDYPDHTYLSTYKFVPHQDAELERRIMENHKKHAGQSPAEADLNLLETARRCELYGMKMHPAKDHEGVPLNLAVAHMGIVVFQNFTKINTFSWAKIRKISFKRKRFLVKLHPEGYGYYKDTVEFFFEGRNECKNFWKKCVEHHGFFRCSVVKNTPRQKKRVLSRGSSFRYSGKTQKQIVEYVRENYVKRQTFQRSQSFRHSSSVHSSVANVGTSISAHPLLPLGDNAVVGTPASLSCGSMTLGSLEEALPQSPGAAGGGGSADFDTTMQEGGLEDEEDYEGEEGEECYRVGGVRAGDTPSLATTSRQDTLSPPTSLASSPQHHYPSGIGPLHQGIPGVQQMQRGGGTSTYDDPEECGHRDEEEEEDDDEDEDATVPAGRPIPAHQQRRHQGQNAEVSPSPSPPPIPPPPLPHAFQPRPFRSTSCQDLVLDEDEDVGIDGYCEDGTPVAVTDLASPNAEGQRIYSSSYPGGTNNGSSSGGESDGGVVGVHLGLGGSLGVGGGSTEDGLSHDDVSHDSYELLEREEEDDEDDDDDDDDDIEGEMVRSPRCAVAEPEIFELEGTEDEVDCDMGILDRIENGHIPIGRTKSDPLPPPSLPLVATRRHHRILTHQKSIDLTPTAGSSEAEKDGGDESSKEATRVEWSVTGSDVDIPYILHKRHLASGASGSSSGGDQDLPPVIKIGSSVDEESHSLPEALEIEASTESSKERDASPTKDGLPHFSRVPSLPVPPAPAPSPGSSSSSSPPHHLAKPSDVVSLIRLPPAQIFSNKDDTLDDEDATVGTSAQVVTEESSAVEEKSSSMRQPPIIPNPPPTAESESTTGESEKGGKPTPITLITRPRGRAFSSGDVEDRKKAQSSMNIEPLTDKRKSSTSSSSTDRRRAEMERRFESRRMILLESSGSSSFEDVPQAPRWSRARGSRADGNKSPGSIKDQDQEGGVRRGRSGLHSSHHHPPHIPPPLLPSTSPLLRPPSGGQACCPSFSFPTRTLSRISERSTTNSEPDSPGRFTGSPPYSPPSSSRSRSSPPSVSTSSSGEERPEEGEEEEGDSVTSELLSSSDRPQPSLCSSPSSSSPSSSRSSPSVRSDRRLPPKEESSRKNEPEESWPTPPQSAHSFAPTDGPPTPSTGNVTTPGESQTPRSASSSFFFDPASSTPPPPSSSSSFLTSPRTASYFDPSTASPHRRLSSSTYFFGDLESPPPATPLPPRSPLSPLPPPPVITLMPPPPPRPQPEKRESGIVVGRVETYYVEEIKAEEACKVVLDPISGQEIEEIGLDPMRSQISPWECEFEAVEEEDELEEMGEEAKEEGGSGEGESSSSSVDFSNVVMDTGPRGPLEKPKKRRVRRDKDMGDLENAGDVIVDFGDGDSPTLLPPPPPPPVRYSGYMPKQSSV